MREIEIKEAPFTWNDNMSEIALEDFSMIQKSLSYAACQNIGMALTKLKIMEEQGLTVDEERLKQEEMLKKWIETHDGEDYCHYCTLNEDCSHGIVCYGGPPIEPPCCSSDIEDLLDIETLLEDLEENEE